MLTAIEKKIVAQRSSLWKGPPAWGLKDGYRLGLYDAVNNLGFA